MTEEQLELLAFEKDTRDHQQEVARLMTVFAKELLERAVDHDFTKLCPTEKKGFVKVSQKLSDLEYGSKEYKACLKELTPVLDHHYRNNRHHPEYFTIQRGEDFTKVDSSIDGMSLVDIVEMLCDWIASSRRMKDGSARRSIEVSKKRFGLSKQVVSLFNNTLNIWGED